MKIEKVYPAGWKMETGEETFYFGEYGKFGYYCNEGVVYKDENAFKTGVGVCYVPEYGFDNTDENDGLLFEFHAKEAVASGIEYNSYVTKDGGYTRANLVALCNGNEEIAEDLFDHLDWMCPETLWDEWLEDEEFFGELESNIPKDKIVIAISNEGCPEEYTGENLKEKYVFDTPKEFINKWYEINEGDWYWVFAYGDLICSGAVDPDDIEIFENHFNMSFEEEN